MRLFVSTMPCKLKHGSSEAGTVMYAAQQSKRLALVMMSSLSQAIEELLIDFNLRWLPIDFFSDHSWFHPFEAVDLIIAADSPAQGTASFCGKAVVPQVQRHARHPGDIDEQFLTEHQSVCNILPSALVCRVNAARDIKRLVATYRLRAVACGRDAFDSSGVVQTADRVGASEPRWMMCCMNDSCM